MPTFRIDDTLQARYLEYRNDFLTMEKFAAYHELTLHEADALVNLGRIVHIRLTSGPMVEVAKA